MKWIALLLQLISFRSSLLESRAMIENAKAIGEKGRRAAIFSGVCVLALIYFLVGSILAVVELGLQIDRGEFFRFSGLLGASLSLVVLAVVAIGVGILVFQNPKVPPPPPPKPESELKTALESFLLTFLSQLSQKLGDGPKRNTES